MSIGIHAEPLSQRLGRHGELSSTGLPKEVVNCRIAYFAQATLGHLKRCYPGTFC